MKLDESAVTRRSFIQTTGALGATVVATGPATLLASAQTGTASSEATNSKRSGIGKVALEEHVALAENPNDPKAGADIQRLLAEMDQGEIELAVLSPTSGQVQDVPDRQKAIDMARSGNDYLANQVAKHPGRLAAFACLPLQDPDAAARELDRSIKELKFKGAMIKGFSQIDKEESWVYCDMPQYWDLWGTMASLDVPMYLHPRYPVKGRGESVDGHPYFRGSGWYFGYETATHALRLMASGLFDKHPNFTVILGHLGEMLPSVMWRVDHRLVAESKRFGAVPAKKPLDYYFRNNFYVTTSGNFCTPTLTNTIEWAGTDRIMFSVDFPYESVPEAVQWFDGLKFSDADYRKIARGNAEKVLRLAQRKTVAS